MFHTSKSVVEKPLVSNRNSKKVFEYATEFSLAREWTLFVFSSRFLVAAWLFL